MSPGGIVELNRVICVPRASGDEPSEVVVAPSVMECSPRERG